MKTFATSLPAKISDLMSPSKPLSRQALAAHGEISESTTFTKNVKLQKGGLVSDLFEKRLLTDDKINLFDVHYKSVAPLCQRWAKDRWAAVELAKRLPPSNDADVRCVGLQPLPVRQMSDVARSSGRALFTVFSAFAGGGGSSLGYRLAGGNVAIVNDFIPEAGHTYARNSSGTIVDRRDIRALLRDPAAVPTLLNSAGLAPGLIDVLDGSPPCSEFSVAGRGATDASETKSYSDGAQRDISGLPLDFASLALIVRPRVVVMENVPGLAGRGHYILSSFCDALRPYYYVAWRILNACDYGVAQARRRVFVIAIRKDVGDVVSIRDDRDVERVFPNRTDMHQTVRTALSGLVQTPEDLRPWFASARSTRLELAMTRLPKNPTRNTRPGHLDPSDTRNFTLVRCAWDRPAPTLTVTGQQPSGLAGAIHPEQDRKFTLPELKRLTGLPDDFVLTGTLAQGAERICRMVPPPLTQAIAESIYRRVLKPYKETSHE